MANRVQGRTTVKKILCREIEANYHPRTILELDVSFRDTTNLRFRYQLHRMRKLIEREKVKEKPAN